MLKRDFQLRFPLGGENRRGGYAQQHRPYTTARAVNVRSVGPLERRGRGGTRPGLSKYASHDFGSVITAMAQVTYADIDGDWNSVLCVIADGVFQTLDQGSVTTPDGKLLTPTGVEILDDNGENIVFDTVIDAANPIGDTDAYDVIEKDGKLYIASSAPQVYDPQTGVLEELGLTAGLWPSNQPLIAVYQERLVLTGENHIVYMSAMGDVTDWQALRDQNRVDQSVFFPIGGEGAVGQAITSVLAYEDRYCVFGCNDSLWYISGNPAPGAQAAKRRVSAHVGIIAPKARCVTPDGLLLFVGRNGLNVWQIGSSKEPEPFSDRVVPQELLDLDPTTNDINMIYDNRSKGAWLFVTPATGVGSHWWIDMENRALWPVRLPTTMQPLAVARTQVSGYSDVLLGCQDGYLRRFNNASATDDSTNIESHVLIGPIHFAGDESLDAMVKEIQCSLADNSGSVTWRLFSNFSAEAVTDEADAAVTAALAGSSLVGVKASGTWSELRNRVERPRVRGPWVVLMLSATSRWAFESLKIEGHTLGRMRKWA